MYCTNIKQIFFWHSLFRRTITTKAATDLTDSEYEVIDDSENKSSITKHKLNLKEDINMSHCVAYGEIKTAEPSHESPNSFESNIYEKVQWNKNNQHKKCYILSCFI